MQKLTKTDITEYALYLHMKEHTSDFDTIFEGHKIISAIRYRYDLDGRFNRSVLKILPLIVHGVDTEEELNQWIEDLTNKVIDRHFLLMEEVTNDYDKSYYIKLF